MAGGSGRCLGRQRSSREARGARTAVIVPMCAELADACSRYALRSISG